MPSSTESAQASGALRPSLGLGWGLLGTPIFLFSVWSCFHRQGKGEPLEDFRVASGVLEGGWVGLGRRAETQSQPPSTQVELGRGKQWGVRV